ncbi:MAG: proteobacterial dedicated sortase system histidine kinase [Gammaproteobacteria bacterium]|nr:proteobacterial dedicated sortase system histidine kinase [Gammaproteobacteria bacterium]MYH85608.1 proteobacterial dedicated sortase system histidine kinase [Gammaproteobacteria bacterium]MYK04645.1 proteobacterial dedicated sortase system histidine kinase [Gammaproteobacteria bacterium]
MKLLNTLASIRFKLIFLSSLLLLIPLLVYQYILAMDEYLRSGQELTVLGEARALATALNDRPELFDEGTFGRATRTGDLYIYPVYSPLSLNDGSLVDWGAYQQYELDYNKADYLRTPLNPARIYANDDSLSFRSMVGEHNGSLYAYFKVRDDNIVYRSRESLSVTSSDFLQISMLTEDGREVQRIVSAPHEPEFLYPFRVNEDYSDPVYEERISGQWYEVDGGYEVELQIPMDMLGERIGFAIFDVDDPIDRDIATVVATHNSLAGHRLGSLQRPTPEIDRIVAGMGRSNSHIQVVDRSGRVLLTVGDIQSATGLLLSNINNPPDSGSWAFFQNNVLSPLYNLILTQPSTNFIDDLYSEVAREGDHIAAALNGEPFTRFRELQDTQTVILEASHPIFAGNEVIGAVIVDQNMNGLRSFRNQALEGLFNTIIAVMLAVTLGLFFFASRISNRVRGLRNQAEGIIDDSGRVRNTIVPSPDSDEIGDLSRSFSSIVERLSQYTSYLENMSSRLSHELRTPVTVVRSSIENLGSTDNPEESQVYIKRAEEGISRLNLILTNMSEATRLEQMLQTSEKETIDVAEVVKGCVEGYRLAYPLSQFSLDIGGYPIFVKGVPEYIAQLLDKLIANAVEFSHPGQPIIVNCRIVRDQAVIRIINAGPYLPQEMKDRIFESMVSVRPHQKQRQPHLGMGLHIARLITDFHNGQIRADNREDVEGVMITVSIPLFYR